MKLVDLLVGILENGWPSGVEAFVQDVDGQIKATRSIPALASPSSGIWNRGSGACNKTFMAETAEDYNTAIVTEHAWATACLCKGRKEVLESLSEAMDWISTRELPPVGSTCLVEDDYQANVEHKCEIIAHTELSGIPVAVFIVRGVGDERIHAHTRAWFRPIPTKDDKFREQAVKELKKLLPDTEEEYIVRLVEAIVKDEVATLQRREINNED